MEQKLPFMRDWYRQGHALLIEQRFHRSYLEEAVRSAPMRMREGAGDVMATLARSSIPLLVLSAGLGGAWPSNQLSSAPRSAPALVWSGLTAALY